MHVSRIDHQWHMEKKFLARQQFSHGLTPFSVVPLKAHTSENWGFAMRNFFSCLDFLLRQRSSEVKKILFFMILLKSSDFNGFDHIFSHNG